MQNNGLHVIASLDTAFDEVADVKRLDPAQAAALAR
jgi:hypothetical protein